MNWKEWTGWLMASVILPALSPLVIAYCIIAIAGIVGKVDTTAFEPTTLFSYMMNKGVYSFLGITVLLGLFQHHKLMHIGVSASLTVLLILLGAIFINSLGVITGETTFSEAVIKRLFYVFTLSAIIYAAILKGIFIKDNNKNNNKNNNYYYFC